MSKKSIYLAEVDYAILKALKDSYEPVRYNKLHKEASNIFGSRIWIKTFNDHLKKLLENGEVIRNEKSRYNVTYEPARKYTEEERSLIEKEKKLLQHFRPRRGQEWNEFGIRSIKSYIRHLTDVYGGISVFTTLDALLAFAEGKENEAQTTLDEDFYRRRIKLVEFLTTLSEFKGIARVVHEMKKEETARLDRELRELEKSRLTYKKTEELVRRFESAERQGWKWQEWGDVVEINGKYHSFLISATLRISDSDFMRVSKKRTTVLEGKTEVRYLSISYQAWIFGTYSNRLPNLLQQMANENISRTNAVYCLASNRNTFFVYNNTDSIVFTQFERFLEDNGFKLEPFPGTISSYLAKER